MTDPLMNAETESSNRQVAPPTLKHFVGQTLVVEQAKVALDAAVAENEALAPMLMLGPPGLGKTLIAHILAKELATPIYEVLGQNLFMLSELHGILLDAVDRSIVFIDECDEMAPGVQTALYKAVEERRIYVEGNVHSGRKPQVVPLANFTLILCSNHEHSIVQPLRDRMKLILRFEYYSPAELAQLLGQRAKALGWPVEDGILEQIAMRGRGTPRLAIRLLEACRRTCRSESKNVITAKHFERTCYLECIDSMGLDRTETQILEILREASGPVRLGVIAARLGLPAQTISDCAERYLLQQGLITKTSQGRCITARGLEHVRQNVEFNKES